MSCEDCRGPRKGDRIRHKKTMDGVRVGGAEPKTIEYFGGDWVIYSVTSATGANLGEKAILRRDFDETMERDR